MTLFFFIWPIFLARAEILRMISGFFGRFNTPQFTSEIIWPLGSICHIILKFTICFRFFQTFFFTSAKLMRQFFLDMKHKIENLLKPMTIACVICMPEIQCHCHPCLHWTCQLHLALHRPLAVVLPTKIWKIGMFILTFNTCH